jgi:hypothetical protein
MAYFCQLPPARTSSCADTRFARPLESPVITAAPRAAYRDRWRGLKRYDELLKIPKVLPTKRPPQTQGAALGQQD